MKNETSEMKESLTGWAYYRRISILEDSNRDYLNGSIEGKNEQNIQSSRNGRPI